MSSYELSDAEWTAEIEAGFTEVDNKKSVNENDLSVNYF